MLCLYKDYRVKHCLNQEQGDTLTVTNEEFNKQLQVTTDKMKKLVAERQAVQDRIRQVEYEEQQLRNKFNAANGFPLGHKVRFDGKPYLIYERFTVGTQNNPTVCYNLSTAKKDGTLPQNCLNRLSYVRHTDLVEGWE